MALIALHCDNFRRFRELRLDLSAPVTVLIGPNGSGKSNVVDALLALRDTRRHGPDYAFNVRGGMARVATKHETDKALGIMLFADAPDGPGVVRATLSARMDSQHGMQHVQGIEFNGDSLPEMLMGPGWRTPDTNPDPNVQEATMRSSLVVHVDPFRAVSPQITLGMDPLGQENGSDLAAVLHFHYNNDRERFDEFEALLRVVLPEIDIVESPLVNVSGQVQTTATVRFTDDSQKYDLAQLSSGIKDAMVLLAAIHFSEPKSLVILEEPENHLHGGAQRAVMQIVSDAASRDGKQFLITTHSEVLVGMAQTEAVFFVSAAEEPGTSVLRRVADLDEGTLQTGLGIDAGQLLTVLGMRPQVILVVEGRLDLEATEPVWEHLGIKDRVLVVNAQGGGAEEIAKAAASLRDGLARFRLPAKVFVLLDGDGDTPAKEAVLDAAGIGPTCRHVWRQEEIEDYLLIPQALASLLSVDCEVVEEASVSNMGLRGKARLEAVLATCGGRRGDLSPRVIVKKALSLDATLLDPEFLEMAAKVQALAGPVSRRT